MIVRGGGGTMDLRDFECSRGVGTMERDIFWMYQINLDEVAYAWDIRDLRT